MKQKNVIRAFLILVFLGMPFSVIKSFSQQVAYPGVIEYEVTINNYGSFYEVVPESSNYWFVDNIEASDRLSFFELLFEKVLNGNLKVLDPKGKEILPGDKRSIQRLLIMKQDTITLTRPYPPYEEFDTIIPMVCQPYQVTAIRFREQWSYDTTTLTFIKNVIEYAPVVNIQGSGGEGPEDAGLKVPLFWVACDKRSSNQEELTRRILYKVGESPDILTPVAMDSNFSKPFMGRFYDRTLSGEIPAYKPESNALSGELALEWEILDALLLNIEHPLTRTQLYPPYDEFDTVVFLPVTLIKAFIFLEEWSFDTNTFSVLKKVTGICPVTEDCRIDDEEMKFLRPVLWIYFSDIWAPYRGKVRLRRP